MIGTFADPHKTAEDLHGFAKLNENRLYKLMKTCMDPQTDLKSLIKATVWDIFSQLTFTLTFIDLQNEFNKRMEQLSATIAPTMAALLRRSSFRIVNQSSIPTLIRHIQKGRGSATSQSKHAQTLLNFVSKHFAAIYKSHIGELVKVISEDTNVTLVEVGLHALAALLRWDGKLAPTDRLVVISSFLGTPCE